MYEVARAGTPMLWNHYICVYTNLLSFLALGTD